MQCNTTGMSVQMYSKIWQAGESRTVCGSSQDSAERIAENEQEVMAEPILGWSWISHGDQGRTVPVVSFKKDSWKQDGIVACLDA